MRSETVVLETRVDPDDILRAQLEADCHVRWAPTARAEAACDPLQNQPFRYMRIETKSEWFIG
jgi:hypothetical protein